MSAPGVFPAFEYFSLHELCRPHCHAVNIIGCKVRSLFPYSPPNLLNYLSF